MTYESNVFNIDTIDDEFEKTFDPRLPWVFEDDDGRSFFSTEEEACAMQRDMRRLHGCDPMTGEPLTIAG